MLAGFCRTKFLAADFTPIGSMGLVSFNITYLLIYHQNPTIHVGKYTSPMDPMDFWCSFIFGSQESSEIKFLTYIRIFVVENGRDRMSYGKLGEIA